MVLSFLLLLGMPGQRIHSGHMACHPTSHVPNNSKVRFCSWWHGGVFRKNPASHLVKQTKRTDLGLPKQKRHATRPPKELRIGKLSEHRQYFLVSCLLFLLVSPLWMCFFFLLERVLFTISMQRHPPASKIYAASVPTGVRTYCYCILNIDSWERILIDPAWASCCLCSNQLCPWKQLQ